MKIFIKKSFYLLKKKIMSNYFEFIPPELLNVILLNLNYTESSLLDEMYNLKLDYKILLIDKYPGYYQIVKTVKEKDFKYRNYNYENAYDEIIQFEIYLKEVNNIDLRNYLQDITEETINKFIQLCFSGLTRVPIKIEGILTDYSIITEPSSRTINFYKYKRMFPNIHNLENYLNSAIDEYSEELDTVSNIYLEEYSVYNKAVQLVIIYLAILEKPELIDRYKDYILNLRVMTNDNLLIDDDHFVLYSYIKNYIKNYELKKMNK